MLLWEHTKCIFFVISNNQYNFSHMFKKMIETTFGKVAFVATLFVLFTVSSFVFYIIPRISESLINEKKYTLHEMSHLLTATLYDLDHRVETGELTKEEAQMLATNIISNYRYGKNGDDYFWVNDINSGTIFIHPHDTVRGTDIAQLTDETGYNFGATMLDMARRGEEGYVDYMWLPKPGKAESAVPKLSHVAVFEPWGWVIGTGIYIDDVEKEIALFFVRIVIILILVLFLLIGLLIFIIHTGTRIESQKNLIRSEFMSLIQHLPIGMFRIRMDKTAPPLLWNHTLVNLLEVPNDTYLHKSDFDLMHFFTDQKAKQRIKNILLTKGEIKGIELELRTYKNNTLWVKVYGKTFRDKNILYFDASVENITDKKISQENLKKSFIELQKIDKMKDEIISITSHELRTPLTIIKGFASILLNETFGTINDKQKTYTQKIINNTNALLEMITNMLDLEKIRANKMPLDIQKISLNKLITKINDDFQVKCTLEGRTLSFQDIDPDIDLQTDTHHLTRILENLIDNAIKYTKPHEGVIEIFTKKVNSDRIEIHVRDNGIGIAESDIHDIFRRFKQVGGHTQRIAGGSGLGLPIARGLVTQLGGTIHVTSTLKKGSDFYIVLPNIHNHIK